MKNMHISIFVVRCEESKEVDLPKGWIQRGTYNGKNVVLQNTVWARIRCLVAADGNNWYD